MKKEEKPPAEEDQNVGTLLDTILSIDRRNLTPEKQKFEKVFAKIPLEEIDKVYQASTKKQGNFI